MSIYNPIAGGGGTGDSVTLNTTNFDKNLSASDDTVQKAMETLDELEASGTVSVDGITITGTGTALDPLVATQQVGDGVTITGTGTIVDPFVAVAGLGGGIQSVSGDGGNISIDDTDPLNPIVQFTLGADENFVTDAEKIVIGNTSGTNTGDQDLSGLALKSNVLELDNITPFTPNADYEPSTKKYVDDNIPSLTGYATLTGTEDLSNKTITDSVFQITKGPYVYYADSGYNIYKYDGVTSELLSSYNNSTQFTISPDGLEMIYSNSNDIGRLYKKSTEDNTEGIPITTVTGIQPSYSPDGTKVTYITNSYNVVEKDLSNGSNGNILTNDGYAVFPKYSIDGNYIYYVFHNFFTEQGIYKIDLGGSFPTKGTQITSSTVIAEQYPVAISPDGNSLVYTNYADGKLYKIDLSGTLPSNGSSITTTAFGGYPNYSIDGNSIYYYNGLADGIYVKSATGTDDGIEVLTGTLYPTSHSQYYKNIKSEIEDTVGKVGTKTVDETDIGNGKVLTYNSTSGKIEYETPSAGGTPFFTGQKDGEQVLGTIARITVKETQTIAGVKVSLGSLPTGADFKIDIRKNGTATTNSIFTSDTPVSITTGQSATNGIYTSTSTSIDNGSLSANDVLYVVVSQIGSVLPGSDLFYYIY